VRSSRSRGAALRGRMGKTLDGWYGLSNLDVKRVGVLQSAAKTAKPIYRPVSVGTSRKRLRRGGVRLAANVLTVNGTDRTFCDHMLVVRLDECCRSSRRRYVGSRAWKLNRPAGDSTRIGSIPKRSRSKKARAGSLWPFSKGGVLGDAIRSSSCAGLRQQDREHRYPAMPGSTAREHWEQPRRWKPFQTFAGYSPNS
jgi:hypothetical protein